QANIKPFPEAINIRAISTLALKAQIGVPKRGFTELSFWGITLSRPKVKSIREHPS
ncbi:unnamed protein product, partial [marine sediment metagenome]